MDGGMERLLRGGRVVVDKRTAAGAGVSGSFLWSGTEVLLLRQEDSLPEANYRA
jgi:hypothetical protein